MDNLLHLGRGAGGTRGEESDELQVACLMGLVSFLAVVPEVQRISPLHASELKNAVAGAIIQSGNIEDKPLTDAGLDGTGEVIQVRDVSDEFSPRASHATLASLSFYRSRYSSRIHVSRWCNTSEAPGHCSLYWKMVPRMSF